MKRLITATVHGALTAVLLAWIACLVAPRTQRVGPDLSADTDATTVINAELSRIRDIAVARIPVDGLDVDRFDRFVEVDGVGYGERAWIYDPESVPPGGTWEFGAGWPFIALKGAVHNDSAHRAPPEAERTLGLPSWVPTRQFYGSHVPLSPNWGGLLANIAIWSVVFWIVSAATRAFAHARAARAPRTN